MAIRLAPTGSWNDDPQGEGLSPRRPMDHVPLIEPGREAADGFTRIIGRSGGLRQAVHKARLLAQADAPVLLQGETGVGKEVFARAIHDSGRAAHEPFVALNCGALLRDLLASELFGYVEGAFTGARRSGMVGKIEAARGGTLFLDEIGEMPLDLQPYLLRVLEGGEVCPLGSNKPRTVRFRLVAACNSDLRSAVRTGRFRMDLFYRVSVTSLLIPALRERAEDIPALVEHFSRGVAERRGELVKDFAPDVLTAFARYSWPGNVRELRNVVEGMALLSEEDVVGLAALPVDLAAPPDEGPLPVTDTPAAHCGLKQVECNAIGAAIRTHSGNLARVAKDLHISKSTLYLKMKKYSLEPMLQEVRIAAR